MRSHVTIQSRKLGNGHPVFIIAEVGVNHQGSVISAKQLIAAAARAGADAVKFQTFRTNALVHAEAPTAHYQEESSLQKTQLEMLSALELPLSAFRDLKQYADAQNVIFLSTPFDPESLAGLVDIGVPAMKIGSGDVTNRWLLEAAGSTGKPVLLSTGMSDLGEVANALTYLRRGDPCDVVLLQCTSLYPTQPDEVNLNAMETLATAFDIPVGFSDHTLGTDITIAAVARGACVLEKHLTLNRRAQGPDHAASIEPDTFATMVHGIRRVEKALGSPMKQPVDRELTIRKTARRSLATRRPVRRGETIRPDMLFGLRPGTGLSPAWLDQIVGARAKLDIPAATLLRLDMLDFPEV